MSDHIAKTRVSLRNGMTYLVLEEFSAVKDALADERAVLTSVTGQSAFPPERLLVTSSEVASVQECSEESWVWQQRAAELHYMRQLEETPAVDRMAAAMERAFTDE